MTGSLPEHGIATNMARPWFTHKLMWSVPALVLIEESTSHRGHGKRLVQSNL